MEINQIFTIILTLSVALLVTFSATPVVMVLAHKMGAIDIPKDKRRMHKKPIPRIGGLAIYYGFVTAVVCFGELNSQMIGILTGSVIIVAVGIIDDTRGLPAIVKFIFQILAACAAVYGGLRIEFFSADLTHTTFFTWSPWLTIPITVLWIVGITNAVNLIDGLDGLAVGVSSIASMSLLALTFFVINDPNSAIVTAAVAGAGFGFMPYNFVPARTFMGDTGSTFLGYILACVSILGLFKMTALISFAAPVLILGLPILDTGFAIIRRIIKHEPIMKPDRGHLHHRLIDLGFTHRQTVVILYAMSGILSLSAVLFSIKFEQGIILLVSILVLVLMGAKHLAERRESMNDEKHD